MLEIVDSRSAPATDATPRERIDGLLSFLRRVARHHRPALAVLAAGVTATIAIDQLRVRSYRSELGLEYRAPVRIDGLGDNSSHEASRLGARIHDAMSSRARLAALIADLHLYPGLSPQKAEDELRAHLTMHVSGDDYRFAFESGSAPVAQAVLARLGVDLIRDDLDARREQATLTEAFLRREIASGDAELERLEAAASVFVAHHPELHQVDPLAASMLTPATGAAPAAEPVGWKPDASGAYLAVQVEALQQGPLASQQATRVAGLRAAEANEQSALLDLARDLARYSDQHPDVVSARGAHAQARAAAERARAEVKAGAPAALRERLAAVASLGMGGGARRTPPEKRVVTSEDAQRTAALEAEWLQASRDVSGARDRHAQLAQRLFDSSLRVGAAGASMVVVDPAYLPLEPLPPGHAKILGLGLLASLAVALLLALAGTLFDDRLYTQEDVARLLVGPGGTASIGEVVPGAPCRPSGGRMEGPDRGAAPWRASRTQAASESERMVAFRLMRFRLGFAGDPRIIAVASARDGECSTDCAVHLATALAEQGNARVLLIDLSSDGGAALALRQSLAALGLLDREVAPDQTVQAMDLYRSSGRANVAVRVVTPGRGTGGVPLDAVAFAGTCRGLLERDFDYVVIDAPPVLASADTNLVAQAADAVLLAARAGRSSGRSVRRAARRLAPLRVLGVALLSANG